MNNAKQRIVANMKLDTDKANRVRSFLKNTGREHGLAPFVAVLLMREVEAWEMSLSGNDQAAELRNMMGR